MYIIMARDLLLTILRVKGETNSEQQELQRA
jgi:hypothetical protein